MAQERRISIVIATAGDPAGIDLIEGRFADLQGGADELFAALKAGVAIDLGGRLVSGLAQATAAFERLIARGVAFNSTLETAELGIAAVLRQFDKKGKFKSFDDAMRASAAAIELLKQKAKESSATFQELVSAYQGTVGAMAAANIPLEKQVDLIVRMSQALAGLGIHSSQILQETRALITGNINADAAAAKILGITAADITAAKAQGQLYEFLAGKVSAFAEAGERGAQTMQTALSKLEDNIDAVAAELTKPIFEAITQGTLDLSKALSDPKVVESLTAVGVQIAKLVEAGYDLTEWAVQNADVLVTLAKLATLFGSAVAAIHLTRLVADIGKKTVALVASKTALDAETVALGRNTAAQAANATARARVSANNWGHAPAGQALRQGLSSTAGMKGLAAGAIGAIGQVAPAALITYVVGELIAQGVIARAEARSGRLEGASKDGAKKATGLREELAEVATLREKYDLAKRISEERAKLAQAAQDNAGDAELARIYRRQVDALDVMLDRVAGLDAAELKRRQNARDLAAEIERQSDLSDKLAPMIAEAAAALAELERDALSPAERLERLQRQRQLAMHGLEESQALFAGTEGVAAEAAGLSVALGKAEVLRLNREIEALEKRIADEAKRTADETRRAADEKRSQADARAQVAEEIAINEARARGDERAAAALERQARLRREMTRLQETAGVDAPTAERAARRSILADEAAQARGEGRTPALSPGTPAYERAISLRTLSLPPPMSSVVPAARPVAPDPTAGAAQRAYISPEEQAAQESIMERAAQRQAEQLAAQRAAEERAVQSFAAYHQEVLDVLAARERREAELAAKIKLGTEQIKNMRTR